ncbi:protein of unknown function [Rhodovastum atsumiense]|nr:protein of unknown function [Rhodovastum atsumiense]
MIGAADWNAMTEMNAWGEVSVRVGAGMLF